jgi:hypothetical protein
MPSQPLMATYDPKLVFVIYGGMPIMGFAEDSFVEVAPAEEGFTRKVGADGEVVRSHSNNTCCDVTVTLLQSSLSNQVLSAAATLDRSTGLGMLPLSIVDINSGTELMAAQAWVETPSSLTFGKEAGDRAWVFHTGQILPPNIGGIIGV